MEGGSHFQVLQKKPAHMIGRSEALLLVQAAGHLSRDCPARQSRATDEAVQGAFAVTNRALRNNSKEAYIELEIRRQHCVCLLDTGSDVTLFTAPVENGHLLRDSDIELLAANGTVIPVIETVTVRTNLGGRTITMNELV